VSQPPTRLLQHTRDERQYHAVSAPEGLRLDFKVSLAGDRIFAFAIDSFVQALAILLVVLLYFYLGLRSGIVDFVTIVTIFVVWNLYFILFELRWQGQTLGKRNRGLRVIDRHGGPLRSDAVIVRNLMRQVELVIPLAVLSTPDGVLGAAPGLIKLVCILWFLVFLFFPLLNRKRLRIGDLVGGTIVVYAPKVLLEQDLGAKAQQSKTNTEYEFTNAQLDTYGVYELQVLEMLLRKLDEGHGDTHTVSTVADKIRKKISWSQPRGLRRDDEGFLRAFYAAQRARLEHKMLMGDRQEFKKG